MKNTAKKLISLLLTLCMVASLSVSAFAEGKKFERYLAISDSIGVYCGVPASNNPHIAVYSNPSAAFPGSYSERLKNDPELGIRSICSCGHPGWRVQEALYALGGSDRTADYFMKYAGDTAARIKKYSPVYVQAMKDADLISINLGFNNIMQAFVYGMYTAFEKEGVAFEGSALDKCVMDSLNRLKADTSDVEAFASLLSALETSERGIVLLKNALKMLPEAAKDFEKSWEELMELIYSANPDADVLVLGLYNPLEELISFTAENSLSLGKELQPVTDTVAWLIDEAADPVIRAMNRYLRSGNSYAKRYVFVDVEKVDLAGTKDGIHLGDVGQQYFYTQMKSAINAHFVPESVPASKTSSAGLLGRIFGFLFR